MDVFIAVMTAILGSGGFVALVFKAAESKDRRAFEVLLKRIEKLETEVEIEKLARREIERELELEKETRLECQDRLAKLEAKIGGRRCEERSEG